MGIPVDMGGDDLYVNNVFIGDVGPNNVGGISQSLAVGASVTTSASTVSFTATAAQLSGSSDVYFLLTGTTGGATNLTLPTVAVMSATIPMVIGNSWTLTIINEAAGNTWTVVTATGWTTTGTLTIATGTSRTFVVRVTGATTMTITSVETATWS